MAAGVICRWCGDEIWFRRRSNLTPASELRWRDDGNTDLCPTRLDTGAGAQALAPDGDLQLIRHEPEPTPDLTDPAAVTEWLG